MIKIIICDDQEIVRDGLSAILQSDQDIIVIGTASNGKEALDLLKKEQPDLLLLDLKMPVLNGILTTKEVKKQFPTLPVLILTTYSDEEWLFDALRAGAAGYLLKDSRKEEIIKAIKGTIKGKTYLDPAVANKVITRSLSQNKKEIFSSQKTLETLTINLNEKELEILTLLAKGFSNPQIASRVYLAPGTVRNYISAIFSKLKVNDRTQAAMKAIQLGLISYDD